MKLRMAWLAILAWRWGAISASAQWSYDNGPLNGADPNLLTGELALNETLVGPLHPWCVYVGVIA